MLKTLVNQVQVSHNETSRNGDEAAAALTDSPVAGGDTAMADSYSTRRLLTETEERTVSIAVEFVRRCVARKFEDMLRVMCPTKRLESPIETSFWMLWEAVSYVTDGGTQLALHPQYLIETSDGSRYRLDFAVFACFLDSPTYLKVAVELDGHDFHERTKEQVAYRNERDRKLQMDGWTVFHVSGSEMFHDGLERAVEIYQFCEKAADAAAGYKADGTTRGTT